MKVDPLFILAGLVTLTTAVYVGFTACRRGERRRLTGSLLWALLSAGLFLQGFAYHLRSTDNRGFNIPMELMTSPGFNARDIILREKWMQVVSALLSGAAVISLGFHYRHAILVSRPQVGRD